MGIVCTIYGCTADCRLLMGKQEEREVFFERLCVCVCVRVFKHFNEKELDLQREREKRSSPILINCRYHSPLLRSIPSIALLDLTPSLIIMVKKQNMFVFIINSNSSAWVFGFMTFAWHFNFIMALPVMTRHTLLPQQISWMLIIVEVFFFVAPGSHLVRDRQNEH